MPRPNLRILSPQSADVHREQSSILSVGVKTRANGEAKVILSIPDANQDFFFVVPSDVGGESRELTQAFTPENPLAEMTVEVAFILSNKTPSAEPIGLKLEVSAENGRGEIPMFPDEWNILFKPATEANLS